MIYSTTMNNAKRIFLILPILLSVAIKADFNTIAFTPQEWEIIKYRKIKANSTRLQNDHVEIDVNQSAGSIIHTLKTPLYLEEVQMNFDHSGLLNLTKVTQGEDGGDDFLLRVGLIYEGEETLGFFTRKLAADWLINIFDKAPKGSGISQIVFHNVVSDKSLLGKEGKSSASKYMYNKNSFLAKRNLNLKIKPARKKKIIAIWLCTDGDETKSSFKIKLSNFRYKIKN